MRYASFRYITFGISPASHHVEYALQVGFIALSFLFLDSAVFLDYILAKIYSYQNRC